MYLIETTSREVLVEMKLRQKNYSKHIVWRRELLLSRNWLAWIDLLKILHIMELLLTYKEIFLRLKQTYKGN